MNNFELASRKKFRFPSVAGMLSVEDLWDLPLTTKNGRASLDDVAKSLYHEIKQSAEVVSFVTDSVNDNPNLQAAFEIVKHVIEVRKEEKKAADQAKERADKRQRIMELIAKKQDQALEGQSLEDLQKMVEAL